jgi:4-hydroxy-3-polyprenylbenzoate decarboxylase
MRLVVGVSGASGAPYAKRLLDFLAAEGPAQGVAVDLVFSETGRQVWNDEIGSAPRYPFPVWKPRDFSAPFCSGSAADYQGMAVVPCSAGCLSRIAHGLSLDLIGRAADVMLKERRRLVLCLRETPLSLPHARAVVQAVEAGAVVMPASPSFYSHPKDIGELVDTVVSRILDRLGIPNELMRRWEGRGPPRLRAEPAED